MTDLHAAGLHRHAATGWTLVRGKGGVTRDRRHRSEWHVQLFGEDLGEGSLYAGAKLNLASIERDLAISMDGNVALDDGGRDRLAAKAGCGDGGGVNLLPQRPACGQGETDDKPGGRLSQAAATECHVHIFVPFLPLLRS